LLKRTHGFRSNWGKRSSTFEIPGGSPAYSRVKPRSFEITQLA
jgi:hypothetical protein